MGFSCLCRANIGSMFSRFHTFRGGERGGSVCVCVCVCVSEREREREGGREGGREWK